MHNVNCSKNGSIKQYKFVTCSSVRFIGKFDILPLIQSSDIFSILKISNVSSNKLRRYRY